MKNEHIKSTHANSLYGLLAFLSGMIGGLFGAGGGGIIYYIFERSEKNKKYRDLFAQTLLVTLPSAIISCIVYFMSGKEYQAIPYAIVLPCAVGGICGAFLSKRASGNLKLIFSILLVASGIISLLKQYGVI